MSEAKWNDVLADAGRLQTLADAVLVGGTAASAHAGERSSFDDDHVLSDIRERFHEVLAQFEQEESRSTSLDGVETGEWEAVRDACAALAAAMLTLRSEGRP